MEETVFQSEEDRQRARQVSRPTGIPGYELERAIGSGSYGEVWAGLQLRTGQRVAVKIYQSAELDRGQTRRELERLREVTDHPSVVTLLDADLDHDPPYFVMPLLARPLAGISRPSPDQAAAWLEQVASGLQHTHDKGLLHCDIKPSNILLDDSGRAMLVDFGQSRQQHEGRISWGTLGYMPPEQAQPHNDAPSVRWDVYALGATFYNLLCGRLPYIDADSLTRSLATGTLEDRLASYRDSLERGHLVPIRQLNPLVDGDLADLLEACLQLDPQRRTPTVSQILSDLERRRSGEPLLCRRPWPLSYALGKRLRRPVAVVTLTAALLLVGGGLFSYAGLQAKNRELTESQARMARQQGVHHALAGHDELARLYWASALAVFPHDQALRLRLALPRPTMVFEWQGQGIAVGRTVWATWNDTTIRLYAYGKTTPLRQITCDQAVAGLSFSPGENLGVSFKNGGFQAFDANALGPQIPVGSDWRWLDDNTVASYTLNDGIRHWDVRRTDAIRHFSVPAYRLVAGHLNVTAMSSGAVLCQTGRDTVQLFNLSDGKPLSQPLEARGAMAAYLSPDGQTIVLERQSAQRSAQRLEGEGEARVYFERKRLKVFPRCRYLGHWPDNSVVLAESGSTEMALVHVINPQGNSFLDLPLPAGSPQKWVTSPDSLLHASLYSQRAFLYNVRSQINSSVYLEELGQAAFSADGKYFLAQSRRGSGRCWRLPDPYQPRQLETGFPNVQQVAYGENWLAALSDSRLTLWQPESGKLLQSYAVGPAAHSLAIHPRAGLAVRDASALYYLPAPSSGAAPLTFKVSQSTLESRNQALAFSPDGRWLASLEGRYIRVFEVRGRSLDRRFELVAPGPSASLAFAPNGRCLAVTGGAGLALWSLPEGRPMAVPEGGRGAPLKRIHFSPDSQWLASCGPARTLIRRAPDWRLTKELPGAAHAAVFHPNKPLLALPTWQRIYVVRYPEWQDECEPLRRQGAEPHENRLNLAWSHGGDLLANTTVTGSELWDVPAADLVVPFLRQSGTSCLAFSPDDQQLAVGTESGRLLLYPWPTRTGSPQQVLEQVERESGYRLDRLGRRLLSL